MPHAAHARVDDGRLRVARAQDPAGRRGVGRRSSRLLYSACARQPCALWYRKAQRRQRLVHYPYQQQRAGFPNLFALSMMTGSKSLACKSRFVRLSWLFSINDFNLLLVSFICFSRSSLESRQRIFGRLIFLVLVFFMKKDLILQS